jgi:hypothetical protein
MSGMRLSDNMRLHDMGSECCSLELTKNECGPLLIFGFLFLLAGHDNEVEVAG